MNLILGIIVWVAAIASKAVYHPEGEEYDRMFFMLIMSGAFDMLTVNGFGTAALVLLFILQALLSFAFCALYWAVASGRMPVIWALFVRRLFMSRKERRRHCASVKPSRSRAAAAARKLQRQPAVRSSESRTAA